MRLIGKLLCKLGFHKRVDYYYVRCGFIFDEEEYERDLEEARKRNEEYGKAIWETLEQQGRAYSILRKRHIKEE